MTANSSREDPESGIHQSAAMTSRLVSLPLLKLPQVADEPAPFWLRRSDQLFAGGLVCIGLTLLFVHWLRLSRWGAEPVEIDRLSQRQAEYRIDINRASRFEWEELEGIGPALASRIVGDREKHGPFHKIEDLKRVHGIGPKMLEKLGPFLEVTPEANQARPVIRHSPDAEDPR